MNLPKLPRALSDFSLAIIIKKKQTFTTEINFIVIIDDHLVKNLIQRCSPYLSYQKSKTYYLLQQI